MAHIQVNLGSPVTWNYLELTGQEFQHYSLVLVQSIRFCVLVETIFKFSFSFINFAFEKAFG